MKSLCFALFFLFTAGMAASSQAGVRTAAISVSATVLASCRIDVASQAPVAASTSKLTHRSECSGSTRPATRAVLESQYPAIAVQRDAAWIRFDVNY